MTPPPLNLAYIGQPDVDLSDLTGQLRSHPQSTLESLGYFPSYSDEMPISNAFPGVKISRKRFHIEKSYRHIEGPANSFGCGGGRGVYMTITHYILENQCEFQTPMQEAPLHGNTILI